MFKIELGKEVKAKVTGLVGITTSRSECLYGCNRYYIQPKVGEDKKVPDGWWVDEDDVEVVGDGVTRVAKDTGGPMSMSGTSPLMERQSFVIVERGDDK